MNRRIRIVLFMSLVAATVFTEAIVARTPMPEKVSNVDVTCEEALKNAGEIKVGMKDTRVLELLGQPTGVKDNIWGYNFLECSQPPTVGSQMIVGMAIIFKDKTVAAIDYATICATGPGR